MGRILAKAHTPAIAFGLTLFLFVLITLLMAEMVFHLHPL